MTGLILHCGAQAADRATIATLPNPAPIGPRHHPVHHADLIELVDATVQGYGLTIEEEAYGITPDGARLFGVVQVRGDNLPAASDYGVALGLRASHDQSLPCGVSLGSRVFVCDNLAFNGEVVMKTRQTTFIEERLPALLADMIGNVVGQAEQQHMQFLRYKATELTSSAADAAMTQLVRMGAVIPSDFGRLVEEWDTPSHEEHAEYGQSVWRLFNAATEVSKPKGKRSRLPQLHERTTPLHTVCDQLVDAYL